MSADSNKLVDFSSMPIALSSDALQVLTDQIQPYFFFLFHNHIKPPIIIWVTWNKLQLLFQKQTH